MTNNDQPEPRTMRESIDAIKAELDHGIKHNADGGGHLVNRDRASGKTAALFEFLHDYCGGFCYLVVCNPVMRELTERRYKQDYPEDEQPVVVTLDRLRSRSLSKGRSRVWATDEVWPSDVMKADPEFRTLTYIGGVGTPYCMDAASKR